MNRSAFYASVRASLFAGKLTQDQVTGMEAILDEWDASKATDSRWLAYIMATPHLETGKRFEPVTENLNYSVQGLLSTFGRHRISAADAARYGRASGRPANQEAIANLIYGGAWGRDNLGNTQAGDGWRFRGRGLSQITGRANYTKFGLAENPEAAGELKTAAHIVVGGMIKGTFTGKKLSNYFDADSDDPVNARQIINRLDRAEDIAGYYRLYLKAVKAASA
jgi:putative chitinase